MNPPVPAAGPATVPPDLAAQVARALAEDIGAGDLTAALIPAERWGFATVITREPAILCGLPYVKATFEQLDSTVRLEPRMAEGAPVAADEVLFCVEGPARALLTGERTALNFVQFLSSTATSAHAYAALLAGTGCRVLDTRKTVPGLRSAQKYAVRVGGGQNHRMGLFDGILIKENHIMAAGSITAAVTAARRGGLDSAKDAGSAAPSRVPVEVEVETLDELREAMAAQADIVLLDDFSLEALREAVAINRSAARPIKLEASGGITRENIRNVALTGVDYISVGAITKHVRAIDLSMRFAWR